MEAGEWIQLERHITGLYAAAGLSRPARIDAKRIESLSVLHVSSLLQLPTTKPKFMSGKNLIVARNGHRNAAAGRRDQRTQGGEARDAEEERGHRGEDGRGAEGLLGEGEAGD
jgi:hypothetical protein